MQGFPDLARSKLDLTARAIENVSKNAALYERTFKKGLVSVIVGLGLLSGTVGTAAETVSPAESTAAIEYLLDLMADSSLEFVRNGKTHTGAEAAAHVRQKYEHYANRIESPEDFIELAATKSLLSGKLYRVRTADGAVPTAEWLSSALADYRKIRGPRTVEPK